MSVDQLPLEKQITVTGTRLYEPIRNICLVSDAFGFSSCALNNIIPVIEPGGGALSTGHIGVSVVIPHGEVFRSALFEQDEPPVWIRLTKDQAEDFVRFKKESGEGHSGSLKRLTQFHNDAAAVQFVMYYERFIDWAKQQAAHNIANLEATWGFGRVVRNAIGHAGRITINDKSFAPVSWGGLTYGPAQHGRPIIGPDLHAPDIMILMLDMDRALDEMNYTPPA